MTKYEKIKNMSVEEMAQFLMNFVTEALTTPLYNFIGYLESEVEE